MKWFIFFFVLFYVLGSVSVGGQTPAAAGAGGAANGDQPNNAEDWQKKAESGEAGTQKQMSKEEREKARKEAAKKGTKVKGPNTGENRDEFFNQQGGKGREGAGGGQGGQGEGDRRQGQGGEGGQQGAGQGDPMESLQKMLGIVQQILAIAQQMKGDQKQDQKNEGLQQAAQALSRDVPTLCGQASSTTESLTGSIAAAPEQVPQQKIVGQRCPKTDQCSREVFTPDTGVGTICCLDPCKKRTETAQGKKAQKDIDAAKEVENNLPGFQLRGPEGEKITSLDGTTKQDMRLLQPDTTQITPDKDKLFVLNPKTGTNLYTLQGTEEGVEERRGIFILDQEGIQKMSVGEEGGALTLDRKGHYLWELPGTTVYDAEDDTYETDSVVYMPQYGLWIGATEQQQQKSPTGAFAHEFVFPTAGMTFGHGRLAEQLKNAIDASLSPDDVDVIIYAKGNQDLDLLGNIGFFPLFIRSVAKGSTSIIYDLNVGVEKKYLIKDKQYEYKISTESHTTKVKTPTGKIIEDSGSLPLRKEAISATQKRLLYERE